MTEREQDAPDEQLLRASAAGDERAFQELYRRHHRPIYSFALHATGRTAVAEDVTQEVFLSLLTAGSGYDPLRGSLRTYLYGIARHRLARQRSQDRGVAPLDDEDELPLAAVSVDGTQYEAAAQADRLRHLHRAIRSLPDRYRDAVVLCHMHGLSYAEAAAVLNCSEGTLASRLNRARAMLARKLHAICLT
jgi:RNA polymerase sigma-70 factor (ECF subfamily)